MSQKISLTLNSLEDTQKLARSLGKSLPDGAIVALNGTLGAGKSQLVRYIAESLSIDPNSVTSPTFTLWNTYNGDRVIHHLDAYRLDSVDEFWEIGGEELFEQEGLIFIEWASIIQDALPSSLITIDIEVTGESERNVLINNTTKVEMDLVK